MSTQILQKKINELLPVIVHPTLRGPAGRRKASIGCRDCRMLTEV